MVWGAFPNAVDVMEPDNIFHLLVSRLHFRCLKVTDSYAYFGYLMINFYQLTLMFFGVVLKIVHGVGQGVSGDVGICGWHSVMDNRNPFVVKIGTSDDDFGKFFV